MQNEIKALEANDTWKIVDLPIGKTLIGCKWVYKIKQKEYGNIERYKVRLVAKGYTQREGIDYTDTYSPIARIATIRTIFAITAIKDWHLEQLDIDNTFLHGDLKEEVYMNLPPGITKRNINQVCRLTKSLYGLKQASKQWYEKLTSFLRNISFTQSSADNSLFLRKTESSFVALLIYVDDIILAGNCMNGIKEIKNQLHTTFKIKDLGQLKYFLGLEISKTHEGIHICQRKYALDILANT